MNRLKRLNIPLIVGGVIVTIVLFIAIYGYQLISLDPFSTNFTLPQLENGNLVFDKPPHPPNEINIWGTDIIGRDIFSRIIYGAKLTIELCLTIAVLRFLVALPFAFLAGFGGKISSKIIDMFNTTFSAIPALLISFIILNLGFIQTMEIESAFIAYVIVLTFVGWGRVATILRERIKDILSKDFIKGEEAIGKNKFLIAIQNVFPHLLANIIIYYFIEISRVLIIIAGLGVLGVYIGVSKMKLSSIENLKIDVAPSYYPEWGSMLASARYAITSWKPWIVLYPALSIFITVLGFNLLGEGLKIELNKRNSKFIIFLKHIPYHLSPRTYLYQIKNMNQYKKNVFIKTAIALGIIIPLIIPASKSHLKVNAEGLYTHLEEFSKDMYGVRELGSEGRDKTSDYIISKLNNSEVEPLFGEDYINEDTVDINSKIVKHSELYIENKEDISLEFKQDYNFFSLYLDQPSPNIFEGKIRRKLLTYKSYKSGNYDENERYFLLLEGELRYNRALTKKLSQQKFIDGLIFSRNDDVINRGIYIEVLGELNEMEDTKESLGVINIATTRDVLKTLESLEGEEIVVDVKLEYIESYYIKNIGAQIKGKDSSKPPMIIACNYDYKGDNNGFEDKGLLYNGSSVAANLEVAKTLKENNFVPERDIYFLFLDGSMNQKKKGIDIFKKTNIYQNLDKDHFVMFLNYLGYKDSDSLYMDTSLLYSDNKSQYDFTKILTKRGKNMDIDIKIDKVAQPEDEISNMNANGSSGISIGAVNDRSRKIADTIEQDLQVIDKESLEKQTQLIIDAITMYDYELKKEIIK